MAIRKKSLVTPKEDSSEILLKSKRLWEDTEANYAIDFSDFLKKISDMPSLYSSEYDVDICINSLCKFQYEGSYYDAKIPNIFLRDKDWVSHNSVICISVITGGVSGGSCWDESDPQPFETYNSISYYNLEDILRKVIISTIGNPFIKIDDILSDIYNSGKWVEDSFCENDYYGNYTNYSYCYIKFWDLYTILSEKHCF